MASLPPEPTPSRFVCDLGAEDPGVPFRRLTRDEYNASIAELLDDDDFRPLSADIDAVVAGGFRGGVTMSPEVVRAYRSAAASVAERAVQLWRCNESGDCEDQLFDFARRAFRHDLSDEEHAELQGLYRDLRDQLGEEDAIGTAIEFVLSSPGFLYHDVGGDEDYQYLLASRLSFLYWGQIPDQELLDLARRGRLRELDVLDAQARRLMDDPRAQPRLHAFLRSWLEMDPILTVERQELDDTLRIPLLASATEFFDYALQQHRSFSVLMSAPLWTERAEVAAAWGIPTDVPSDSSLGRYQGILSHPAVTSPHSAVSSSNLIRRGVFVSERVVCQTIGEPPDINQIERIFEETREELGEDATMREQLAAHREHVECATCHQHFDGFGFAFENYDHLGRWRETDDRGDPVDASGDLVGHGEEDGPFANAADLMPRLADSERVHACFVRNVFRFAFLRDPDAGDGCDLSRLLSRFTESDGDIVELFVSLATTQAIRRSPPNTGAGTLSCGGDE